jgi:hypothetical protein
MPSQPVRVVDDGDGTTLTQATDSFRQYGDTWKSTRRKTIGEKRVLHGSKGAGRLFAFTLGRYVKWETIAESDTGRRLTLIEADREHPKKWIVRDAGSTDHPTGTVVTVDVPQGKTLGALEKDESADDLLARPAPYLLAYPDVAVTFDGTH